MRRTSTVYGARESWLAKGLTRLEFAARSIALTFRVICSDPDTFCATHPVRWKGKRRRVQTGAGRFFITGGTLPPNASSYIARQADADLLERLREGDFCYVLTTRQMGKSSLMVRTADALRAEGVSVVMLDLTALGRNLSVEQWYGGLLLLLGEQLDLADPMEDFWLNHPWLGPLQRWMEALDQIALTQRTGNLVLFVDEIDAVRGLSFSTDEFFAGIRACYNRRSVDPRYRRLTFCLLGVAAPSDLIRETNLSPFNIGHRVELGDFTLAEARFLAQGLRLQTPAAGIRLDEALTEGDDENVLEGKEDPIAPSGRQLLQRVFYWTEGHPYLTQRLCRALAETALPPTAPDSIHSPRTPNALVDVVCQQLFLSRTARDSDDNLAFVHHRLLNGEVDLAAILDLYGRIYAGKRIQEDETNLLHTMLRLAGIARVQDGIFFVRNRIYRQVFDRAWIQANLPDAEKRRQRSAYRRGVAFAGVGASMLIALISTLALVSFRNAKYALR